LNNSKLLSYKLDNAQENLGLTKLREKLQELNSVRNNNSNSNAASQKPGSKKKRKGQ
jgi:hypothetical protein